MKRCDRCGTWFHETDSSVCNPCWEDMGQMHLWDEPDTDPPIDTFFDREEEARGWTHGSVSS